jgi:hypothetical protein
LNNEVENAGVMEWRSDGVMKEIIQVEFWALSFSNTPVLQERSLASSAKL